MTYSPVSEKALTSRPATMEDATRIAEIYNQGILDRIATFETEPRAVGTIRGWFDQPYPIVVVEAADEVVAWANASSYRPRACYAGNAEFSVYVDRAWRGKGAGRAAMLALIDAARTAGLEKLISRVFVENAASRRLLGTLGFREVGVYERHATLDGVWRDVVIVERMVEDRSEEPWGALWQPDPHTLALWPELTAGLRLHVEKQPWESGRAAVGYESEVVSTSLPAPWVEIRATWKLRDIHIGGLEFRGGDDIREFFSPRHPYNAFAVYAPDGTCRGWYGNVTWPPRVRRDDNGLALTWPDLVLDVVVLPDGTITLLDEDEIASTGFTDTSPWLVEQMFRARDELRRKIEDGFFPRTPDT